MATVSKILIDLLNDYKKIMKKQLNYSQWSELVDRLELRRKDLREQTEVGLYHKAQHILDDLNSRLASDNNPSWYSGIDEFNQHLKNMLCEYQIENNKIVHSSQQASRAMVEAIQIMQFSASKTDKATADKLDCCGHIVAKFGTREQQEKFSTALKNFQHQNIKLFLPLIKNFERYLDEFTSWFNAKVPAMEYEE